MGGGGAYLFCIQHFNIWALNILVEQITCVGGWGDFGLNYLIADVTRMNNHGERSLRDRFRCFTYYEKTMESSKFGKPAIVAAYDVGTSDLATCIGLHSPDEAETTLYFKKGLI